MRNANRRFVLKARPEGIAGPEHFTEEAVAVRSPEPGEVLLETMYVSVDPAMRVWVSGNPGYVPRVEIGEVMRAGGIARVVESRAAGFAAGDLVRASVGWQSHPTLPAQGIEKLDLSLAGPLDWLGLLGLTGKTGYFGMREVGAVRPGETVLVSGAAGGVGQIAGQVARIEECRVVGIAGGVDKCAYLAKDLGFDAAIDYKAEPDLTAAIARACPNGVDVFFDNVGGPTLDAALANLRVGARVVICGRVSQTASAELLACAILVSSSASARASRDLSCSTTQTATPRRITGWRHRTRRAACISACMCSKISAARLKVLACCSAARISTSSQCRYRRPQRPEPSRRRADHQQH